LKDSYDYAKTHVGTPFYMSPEQVMETKYNEKSDIWSLGCLIYELAALHPPFKAQNHLALATKIRAGYFDRIPHHYSGELDRLIRTMIQVDQHKRPSIEQIIKHPRIQARMAAEREREREQREREEMAIRRRTSGGHHVSAGVAPAPCPSCSSLSHAQQRLREESASLQRRLDELQRREQLLELREKKAHEKEVALDKREVALMAAKMHMYRQPLQSNNNVNNNANNIPSSNAYGAINKEPSSLTPLSSYTTLGER
jgi:NIMA (never in mitosis gene a)-related kinase